MHPTTPRRMLRGLAAGVAAATALSAWVLLVAPLGGSGTVGRVVPISASAAVGAYYAALPAAGVVAGLLWPLGRSRLGAALAARWARSSCMGASKQPRASYCL